MPTASCPLPLHTTTGSDGPLRLSKRNPDERTRPTGGENQRVS
jgi:hypothetical protein